MKLDISFPKGVFIRSGFLNIRLDEPYKNIIKINNKEYIPYYLDNLNPGNKGSNSYILKLVEAQNVEEDDIYPMIPDLIIKISKTWKDRIEKKKSKRFKIEINALIECNEFNLPNVTKIFHHGLIEINSAKKFTTCYHYYTMEYAEMDLTQYLCSNRLGLIERLELGIDICESLKQLWSLGYYHRDIKPDNILFIGNSWIISDLGLAENRNSDAQIDNRGEWIGPRGWMSPESMNKFLCEGKPWGDLHNSEIDHQSDIYQLGKILWFIIQGNSPEGGIRRSDFLIKNDSIYQLIRTMLNNQKTKRISSIEEVISSLKKEHKKVIKHGRKLSYDLEYYN